MLGQTTMSKSVWKDHFLSFTTVLEKRQTSSCQLYAVRRITSRRDASNETSGTALNTLQPVAVVLDKPHHARLEYSKEGRIEVMYRWRGAKLEKRFLKRYRRPIFCAASVRIKSTWAFQDSVSLMVRPRCLCWSIWVIRDPFRGIDRVAACIWRERTAQTADFGTLTDKFHFWNQADRVSAAELVDMAVTLLSCPSVDLHLRNR